MNSLIRNMAADEQLPEHPTAPRLLSSDETGIIAAGATEALTQSTLDSRTEVDRRVAVDRTYRK